MSDGSLFSEIVKEDVTTIFGNIDAIADLERRLLDELLKDSNLTTESISRTFASFAVCVFQYSYLLFFILSFTNNFFRAYCRMFTLRTSKITIAHKKG